MFSHSLHYTTVVLIYEFVDQVVYHSKLFIKAFLRHIHLGIASCSEKHCFTRLLLNRVATAAINNHYFQKHCSRPKGQHRGKRNQGISIKITFFPITLILRHSMYNRTVSCIIYMYINCSESSFSRDQLSCWGT